MPPPLSKKNLSARSPEAHQSFTRFFACAGDEHDINASVWFKPTKNTIIICLPYILQVHCRLLRRNLVGTADSVELKSVSLLYGIILHNIILIIAYSPP